MQCFPARLFACFAALILTLACGEEIEPDPSPPNGQQQNGDKGDNGDNGDNGDPQESTEDPCTFNEDCIAEERCECDIEEGCFCRLGPRGTGQSGVDTCDDGNDCETALCVEGHDDLYYCSGPCEDEDDCGPALPVCADIAFVGRICIREA